MRGVDRIPAPARSDGAMILRRRPFVVAAGLLLSVILLHLTIIWRQPWPPQLQYLPCAENEDAIMQTYMAYRYGHNLRALLRGDGGSLFASNAFALEPAGSLLNSDNRFLPSLASVPGLFLFPDHPDCVNALAQLLLELLTMGLALASAWHWSGRHWLRTAIFAVIVTAIPFRFLEYSRLQGYSYFLTVAIIAVLLALLRRRSFPLLGLLALLIVANAYTSVYYTALLAPACLLTAILLLPALWRLRHDGRQLLAAGGWLAAAAAIIAVGTWPLVGDFVASAASPETNQWIFGVHGRTQVQQQAADPAWREFATIELPRQQFHRTIRHLFDDYNDGFSLVYGAYLVGIGWPAAIFFIRARRDGAYWLLAGSLLFYLLTNTEPLFRGWLVANPLFSYLRLYYRSIFVICILGGFAAVAGLTVLARGRRWVYHVALALAVGYYFISARAMFATAQPQPLPSRSQLTEVGRWLARARDPLVAFLPMGHWHDIHYLGTALHLPRLRLVNGFSQHYAFAYFQRVRLFNRFPEPASRAALQTAGVEYLVLDRNCYRPESVPWPVRLADERWLLVAVPPPEP